MPSAQGTDPGSPALDGDGGLPTTPAGPVPLQRGRRGRAAVDGLPSTAEFSNPYLPTSKRALNLCILLVVTGSTGTMREISRKLLDAHAGNLWHWTCGHSEQSLTKRLADRLGRSARRTPSWPEIEELFAAHLPPAQRGPLLALAAGLFSQAYGHLPDGYTGPVERPAWIMDAVIHAATIRETIAEALASAGTVAQTGDTVKATGEASAPVPGSMEKKLWDTLAITNRGFQELQRQFHDVKAELCVAQARVKHSEAARDLHRQMTASLEGSVLWGMVEQAWAQQHPELTREEVRNLMYEQLRRPADTQLA